MTQYHYTFVDVFTNAPFSGNQLAVFTDAKSMPPELMAKIPGELNLSECTYILPPDDPANQFKVRIFTPGRELPMAGHPTIGTGFVLARMGLVPSGDAVTVRFEEGVGVIPVEIRSKGGVPDLILMDQPVPTFQETVEDRAGIAALMGIEADGLDDRYPIQNVSSGVPFLFIPVKDLATMRRLRLQMDIWERNFKDAPEFFMFSLETERPGSTAHCRMFGPAMGITEDPATGAAHGPLAAYLFKYGVIKGEQIAMTNEQGFEMGRPSMMTVLLESRSGEVSRVRVGGQSRFVGEGYLEL